MTSETICFPAQVVKVQTLADGGLRLTLDLPEDKILEVAKLMECKRVQAYGDVRFTPRTWTDLDNAAEKIPEGSSPKMDSSRVVIRRDRR